MNQEEQQLLIQIQELMRKVLICDQEFGEESPILGAGGMMDSVTAFQFITEAEERFGVDIMEDDVNLDSLETVGTLARYIGQARRGQ